jgi:CRISPR system Cascade subunit CasA
LRDDRTGPWTRRLDEQVDAVFFERLWDAVDRPPEEADPAWIREVLCSAEEILREAMHSVPLPSVRRYRALAKAEGLFYGAARKHFGEAGVLGGGKSDAA